MNVEIWWQESTRSDSWRHFMPGAWFWRDDDCEEDMGPFESRSEALDDYRELRSPRPA